MKTLTPPIQRTRRKYMMAMVLGTAIAALGPTASARAAEGISARDIQAISRYCTTCWRNANLPVDRWQDCTQDVLCRLLHTLAPQSWSRVMDFDSPERREFIRAIDAVKKRTQRERQRWHLLPADVADASPRGNGLDREALDRAMLQVLNGRQARILNMTRAGWSVADIASELNLSGERVSDEKYKAIRKLRQHFQVDA